MKRILVPPDEWIGCFQKLSEEHQNQIVSVEAYESAERREVREVPLEGIVVTLDGDQEVIAVIAREVTRGHVVHTTKDPLHVTLDQADNGGVKSVQIESAEGAWTVIHFRAERVPEAVQAQTLTH